MGKIVTFLEFDNYLDELQKNGVEIKGTILDANILITLSYTPKDYHQPVLEFTKDKLYNKGIDYFTTVNTTNEYLEFYRRLLLTEHLRDAIDETSKWKLPNKKRQVIRTHSGILKNRETTQGKDPVFHDRELKEIRKKFTTNSKDLGLWSKLCKAFLSTQLQDEYKNLQNLGVQYLSINNEEQMDLFTNSLEWEDAISVSARSGAHMSDAMILNALQATKFPFALSVDVDVIYVVLMDPSLKDIIVPNELIDDPKNKELKRLIDQIQ